MDILVHGADKNKKSPGTILVPLGLILSLVGAIVGTVVNKFSDELEGLKQLISTQNISLQKLTEEIYKTNERMTTNFAPLKEQMSLLQSRETTLEGKVDVLQQQVSELKVDIAKRRK